MILCLILIKIFNRNLFMGKCLSFLKQEGESRQFHYTLGGIKLFGLKKTTWWRKNDSHGHQIQSFIFQTQADNKRAALSLSLSTSTRNSTQPNPTCPPRSGVFASPLSIPILSAFPSIYLQSHFQISSLYHSLPRYLKQPFPFSSYIKFPGLFDSILAFDLISIVYGYRFVFSFFLIAYRFAALHFENEDSDF